MSEPMSEQAGPAAGISNTTDTPLHADGALEVGSSIEGPSIAPDHEAPPKPDAPKVEASNAEASRIEVSKLGAKPEPKAESEPGKLIVMAPTEWSSNRSGSGNDFTSHVNADQARAAGGKRRFARVAAVVALATCVGALSGALATAGVLQFAAKQVPMPVADNGALEASIARIDADVIAIKASVEKSSKTDLGQFNRTNDRLDKLEKAQAEPMAKLAKLSETLDKLRIAAAVPAPPAAPQATAPAAAPPKVEVGTLPMVEGWRLRDVANGGALIEGREGLYEVYAGDPVPGLGRIDAIRRQDGRWVVVTSRGLIVAR